MEYLSKHRIRFDDVDGAGIVYYPKFFHLCHRAFEDWFNQHGPCSYPELISDQKAGFPTVAIKSDFLAPLSYGDVAKIKIAVMKMGNSSLTTRYNLYRASDDRYCFSAEIITVYCNLEKNKPVNIPVDIRKFLSQYLVAS